MSDCRLILGDSRDVLPTLDAGSVDCVVTDPPYGTGQYTRAESGQGKKWGTNHHKSEWDVWSLDWLEIALGIAPCCVVFSPEKALDDLIRFAKDRGQPYRLLAWCKPDPLPLWSGEPGYGIDPIVAIGKLQKVRGRNWFQASTPRKGQAEWVDHPHQKPLSLMRWLVPLACPPDGTVLDPFAGSGSTLLASLAIGFNCIGIENHEPYFAIAEARIAAHRAETPLFAAPT